jgi:hypothetical protein
MLPPPVVPSFTIATTDNDPTSYEPAEVTVPTDMPDDTYTRRLPSSPIATDTAIDVSDTHAVA